MAGGEKVAAFTGIFRVSVTSVLPKPVSLMISILLISFVGGERIIPQHASFTYMRIRAALTELRVGPVK
jgi:hypothetical protein